MDEYNLFWIDYYNHRTAFYKGWGELLEKFWTAQSERQDREMLELFKQFGEAK